MLLVGASTVIGGGVCGEVGAEWCGVGVWMPWDLSCWDAASSGS